MITNKIYLYLNKSTQEVFTDLFQKDLLTVLTPVTPIAKANDFDYLAMVAKAKAMKVETLYVKN